MATSRSSPRAPRIDVNEAATLVADDGSEQPVTMLDVSSAGFRLKTDELLHVDERVLLRTSSGQEVRAEIRWVRGFEAGGEFLDAPGSVA